MEGSCHIFEGVEEPRRSNATRHDLHEMLMIGGLATPCGGEGCCDMALFGREKEAFLRRFMRLEHGIAGHDALSDLFNALDPASFPAVMQRLVEGFAHGLEDVGAIDGKALRRSFARADRKDALMMVQAFASEARLVPGQVAVREKSNGITALPALPDLLDLKGRIVTADAMHSRRTTAKTIKEKGGDRLMVLKGNQGTLFEDVGLFPGDPARTGNITSSRTVDADHGRIETRIARVCTDIDRLKQRHDRPGPQAIATITATREINGAASTATRHDISSLALTPDKLLHIARSHRAIKNSLHRVLDVAMNEDGARNRTGNAALYGAAPERGEFDTRDIWDSDDAIDAVSEAFRIIARGVGPDGTQLADERESLLRGFVNMLDAQTRRLDRAAGNLTPKLRDLQHSQHGSEIRSRELELVTGRVTGRTPAGPASSPRRPSTPATSCAPARTAT